MAMIRAARIPEDAAGLAEIYRSAAQAHAALRPDIYRVPDAAAVEARFRAARSPGADVVILVAETAGHLVGFAEVVRLAETSPASMIRPVPAAAVFVAVLTEMRGAGIGSDLLIEAERVAHRLGALQVTVDVLADNTRAVDFYVRRFGYSSFGLLLAKPVDVDHPR